MRAAGPGTDRPSVARRPHVRPEPTCARAASRRRKSAARRRSGRAAQPA